MKGSGKQVSSSLLRVESLLQAFTHRPPPLTHPTRHVTLSIAQSVAAFVPGTPVSLFKRGQAGLSSVTVCELACVARTQLPTLSQFREDFCSSRQWSLLPKASELLVVFNPTTESGETENRAVSSRDRATLHNGIMHFIDKLYNTNGHPQVHRLPLEFCITVARSPSDVRPCFSLPAVISVRFWGAHSTVILCASRASFA
ncbi:hypothetical protein BaRGS_00022006 [Batillaria attramentaria]|uniref:FAS1 domain-containing protein n=1 Tax=Batillaria attramentaria TaxID=370345 RepID=A0ABD0KI49_9CAEN